MIYDIKLSLRYGYRSGSAGGRHLARVTPLDLGAAQRLVASLVTISPRPDERLDGRDFFGNATVEFAFHGPHDGSDVVMQARVDRRAVPMDEDRSVPLAQLAAELAAMVDVGAASPLHARAVSARVPVAQPTTTFARAAMAPGMTAQAAVLAIGRALHDHMTFDAKATTVDTPLAEAFAARKGVCQDFSHILIACLRGVGIPAGYVSGFLRTTPPPGKARLEGADAMHAWVRAWCGAGVGWVEYDPTNDCLVGTDHIVVAYGRDYSDVAPIKGSLRIAGGQKAEQRVDVIPVED
ncbi:MAG: transglutaminase family protein [Paracoccaceae bacterium]